MSAREGAREDQANAREKAREQKKRATFSIKSLRTFQQTLGFLTEGGDTANPDVPSDP